MDPYKLSHLPVPALFRGAVALAAMDRGTNSLLLAHIAEIDAEQHYRALSYSSTAAYCMGELLMSNDAAYKRVGVARVAHRFPAIFPAISDGRLNITSVLMLSPHLTPENADELFAVASRQTKERLEMLLAERFPRPDLPTLITAPQLTISSAPTSAPEPDPAPLMNQPEQKHETVLTPERVASGVFVTPTTPPPTPTPDATSIAPARTAPARIAPLSPERFGLQLTIAKSTHDKLRHAQALLRHQVPSGDIAQVLDRALDALIDKLEKRKFAATSHPRPRRDHVSADARHIPADVKREVWERDEGQCTYMSDSGRRCEERGFLEFDHMDPVALGGEASAERIRLRCRAHNQLEAELVFGPKFMARKREEARRAKAKERSA